MISSSSNPSGEIREAALEGPGVWPCISTKFKGKKNPIHSTCQGRAWPRGAALKAFFSSSLRRQVWHTAPKPAGHSPSETGSIHGAQAEHQGRNLVPRWPRLNCGFVQGGARTPILEAIFSSHSWTQNPNFPVLGKFMSELNEYSVGLCHLRRNKSSKTPHQLSTPGCLSVSSTQIWFSFLRSS